jgi:zinc protease
MELLSTKIKIVLLLIACCGLLMAAYWAYMKQKKPALKATEMLFKPPKDKITKRVLPNGMHLLVYQNDSFPKVLVQMAYDVGSYVEEFGERGLAHLVEHMIFKGTDTLSETDIDAIARKYGATYNAYTSMDVTTYYFEANKNNWKPFLAILADCMHNVRFDSQHLASEVKAVVQELKMNKDSYWKVLLLKALELSFPANHPYHMPTIGFKDDLLTLSAEQVKAFYKKYYRADRATLFVVGDVDVDVVVTEVERLFDSPAPTTKPPQTLFPAPHTELAVNNTRFYEDVKSDHVALYWSIPGQKDEQDLIVDVVEAVLGAGHSGRLHRVLVDEHKVAASASVYALKLMEGGVFFVLLEPLPGKKDVCVELVKEELKKLATKGVSDVDLARIAKTKKVEFFEKMINFSGLVSDWLHSYFATRDELELFNSVNRYSLITSKEVQDFATAYLDPFLASQAEVLPLPENKKELRQQMKAASDELDKKILQKHQRSAPTEEPRAALQYQDPEPLVFNFPKPEKTITLPNGLTVLLVPLHHVPMITVVASFKDADYFVSAKEGHVFDLMMQMLLEGTKGSSKKETVDFFEQRGASFTFDGKGASLSCLTADLSVLLERFITVLSQPTFASDALEKLKKIAIDSLHRSKDEPKDIAARLLKNAMYKNTPYEWTYDEAIAEITSANASALKALHKQYVTAENLVVSVAGSFDPVEMEQVIRAYFGTMQTGVRLPAARIDYKASVPEQIDCAMTRDQVVLMYGRLSPATIYDNDYVPLKILNYICFNSLGSRIYKIRERTGLFYYASGEFAARAKKNVGFDYIRTIVNPENLEKAEQEIFACLQELAAQGVTLDELNAAKHSYEKDVIDLISSNFAIGKTVAGVYMLDLDADYHDKVLRRVHSLTLDEVNALVRRYVDGAQFVRVRVGRV